MIIALPKGSYVPQFEVRPVPGDESREAAEVRDTRRGYVRTNRLAWFAIGAVAAGVCTELCALAAGPCASS